MVLFSFNKFSVILSYHPTVSFLETHLKKKERDDDSNTYIYKSYILTSIIDNNSELARTLLLNRMKIRQTNIIHL